MFTSETMYLAYRDKYGELNYQHWEDLQEVGYLLDEDGDDMDLVGWSLTEDFGEG